ncbi:MAG: shikimate dehydrogenase, partial [Planctomycetes bacterium]|nr:shikimate dehydrogenase [Planctomycetota bacterium]
MSFNFCPELVGSMSQGAAGNPTAVMVEAAFSHHGLNWRYINMEVAPESLADAVRGAWAMGYRGFNCSMPHKVKVIEYLDGLGKSAEIMGAVNCVVRRGDQWIGENTDGKGFLRSLTTVTDPKGKSILMFGAGGAARAIAVELGLAGVKQITVVNRSEARGSALAGLLTSKIGVQSEWLPWLDNFKIPSDRDIVVNATSIGLY